MTQYHQQKLALGCTTTVVLVSEKSQKDIDVIFARIWLLIFEFEKRFSRFLNYSELSIFNKNAGSKQKISQQFYDLLKLVKEMSTKTEGLYNPFILPALHKNGYKNTFIKNYSKDEVVDYSHRAIANINDLIVNKYEAEIPPNTALDLGGIGKGYLADTLFELKELKAMHGFWISIGGDVIGKGFDIDSNWQVFVQDAKTPETNLENTYTSDGSKFAIASSGVITRKGVHNNKQWHHIIDPRTQSPANTDITLATVEANTACQADIFAKALVILGSKEAKKFIKKHKISSTVIQTMLTNKCEVLATGKFTNKSTVKDIVR